jgi:chemotaxis receptor (MCP) glutamine deamidase CheD
MLRAQNVVDAARKARSRQHVRVALGELKVACGADVVLETEPLTHGFALAVFDPESHTGGILTSAAPEAGSTGADTCLDASRALPALIDSVVRTGGDRRRLSFVAAGDVSTLSTALEDAMAAATGPPRGIRLRKLSRPMVLILDLGNCRARFVEANGSAH